MSSHVFHKLASHTERVGTSGRRGLKCKEKGKGVPERWVGVSPPRRRPLPQKGQRLVQRCPFVVGKEGRRLKGPLRGSVGVLGGGGGT